MALSALTDQEIMRRIVVADAEAFKELLNRFERKVFALAWRLTGNQYDAQDLTQDVFLKVWKNAQSWQPSSTLNAWLYRVAYNQFIDKQRQSKPAEALNAEEMASPTESIETTLIKQSQSDRIQAAVNSLPDRQKQALILCYYQELKAKEAAEIMGLTLGATEALLFRARQTLKDLLEKEKSL